jgi:phosphoribosylamine---glycine ligase
MAEIDVMVIGGGGREYELARQMNESEQIDKVYIAPGNAGTALFGKGENVALQPADVAGITDFVRKQKVHTVIIGPDAAIAAGLGNALRAEGIAVFGPTKEAGRLESSKAFSAEFMRRHGIPQPESRTVHSLLEAKEYIEGKSPDSYVLKADGLAAGKGVVLPNSTGEAERTLADMFAGEKYDGAGKSGVVIQERLHGPEISAFAVTDGADLIMLPFSQDHKRLNDHDEGPNTGGMGAYSPLNKNIANDRQAGAIHDIAERTIKGMADDGTPYQGVLYLGLMLPEERGGDPVVIEYNARFGDPETQVILPALSASGFDVAAMLLAAASGDIAKVNVPEKVTATALTVCLAASGYPESPRKGDEIFGLEKNYDNVIVHHAGTKREGDKIITSGGRVLYVTGIGTTPDEAAECAYAAIGEHSIHFDDMHYRTDIGHQIRKRR